MLFLTCGWPLQCVGLEWNRKQKYLISMGQKCFIFSPLSANFIISLLKTKKNIPGLKYLIYVCKICYKAVPRINLKYFTKRKFKYKICIRPDFNVMLFETFSAFMWYPEPYKELLFVSSFCKRSLPKMSYKLFEIPPILPFSLIKSHLLWSHINAWASHSCQRSLLIPRGICFAPLWCPFITRPEGTKHPNIHFRTHTHIFRHERGSARFFSFSLCAHDASLWRRRRRVFLFVCATTNQKAAKHTPAKNKLQKLALGRGGGAPFAVGARMKNDARRGIKVSEMGSPTVWLTDWLYVLGNRQMRIKGRLQTPSARFSHAGSQTDNARELLDYHTLCRCGEREVLGAVYRYIVRTWPCVE